MNAIRIGKVWLNEGPLDGTPVLVRESQNIYEHNAHGRTHTYSRIGTTNSFFYAGASTWTPENDCGPYEIVSTSLFRDEPSSGLLRFRLASINWLHKLRSLMG